MIDGTMRVKRDGSRLTHHLRSACSGKCKSVADGDRLVERLGATLHAPPIPVMGRVRLASESRLHADCRRVCWDWRNTFQFTLVGQCFGVFKTNPSQMACV